MSILSVRADETILSMLSSQSILVELKLWRVSKTFKSITQKHMKKRLQQSQRKIQDLEIYFADLQRELPELSGSAQILQVKLARADIQALRQLNQPPFSQTTAETALVLWLLLLDSFGFDITTKAKNVLNEALQVKATNRSKVERFATVDAWSAIQAQMKDSKLSEKLGQLEEVVYGDPVKPE